MGNARNYVQIVVGGLLVLAAAILIIANLYNDAEVHYYWKTLQNQSVGLVMFFSAIGGVVLFFAIQWLAHGSMALWRQRRQESKARKKAEGEQRKAQKRQENEAHKQAQRKQKESRSDRDWQQ